MTQDLPERARTFATWLDGHAATWERTRTQPRELFAVAADHGLCGLLVPTALGGAGLGVAAMAEVTGILAAADFAATFALVVHNNLAGALAGNGTPEQRERYLAPMVAGRCIGAFLLTEPGAGSDAAALATTAVHGRLDGEKAWITNAGNADLLSVYAQSVPGSGPAGIASFLVDADAAGVTRLPPYGMLGGHVSGTGGFRFDDVALGAESSFVPAGRAFRAAMVGIDIARVNVAAMCVGMMRRGLEVATEGATQRSAFGRPVAEFQGVQWQLADVATNLEAAGALTSRAAEAFAAGDPAGAVLAAHAKKFSTRVALTDLATCMQVLGARGFTDEGPLARHMAAAKMAQYLDGTTEIQNVVIARSLFGRR